MRVVKKGKSSVTKPNLILRIHKLTLEKGTAYLDDFRLKFILLILVLRMPAVWSGYSEEVKQYRKRLGLTVLNAAGQYLITCFNF